MVMMLAMVSMVTLRGMMMWLLPCTVEEDVHLCQVFGQIENVLLMTFKIFAGKKKLLFIICHILLKLLVNVVTFLVTSRVRTVRERFSFAASDARLSSKSLLWV